MYASNAVDDVLGLYNYSGAKDLMRGGNRGPWHNLFLLLQWFISDYKYE